MSYIARADWSQCKRCGQCLTKCPVMELPQDEARREIVLLLEGETPKRLFKECALCMKCNHYCPQGLRPYELILQRLTERKSRRLRLPAIAPYFMTGLQPNFFQDLYRKLTPGEKAILANWARIPPAAEEVLFIGCFGKLFVSDLENSRVLKSLPKFGPTDICCGEIHYRFGCWDAYRDIVARTLQRFRALKTERLVCYCGSCYAMLSEVMPRVYGRELPFKLISLYQWLLEKYEQAELKVTNPRHFKAAIQESCYVSKLGPEFGDALRRIYTIAGVEVVEMEHNRERALSCGIASIAREFSVGSAVKLQTSRLRETKQAGACHMAVNCPGCFLSLTPGGRLTGVKVHYMPEELLRAFGDDIHKPAAKIMGPIMKALAGRLPLAFKTTSAHLPRISTNE